MRQSRFKTETAHAGLKTWVREMSENLTLRYEELDVETRLGTTRLLAARHEQQDLEPILFIPGARTCGIFWDFRDHLHSLGDRHRIYLLDVVGQPSLSSLTCPVLKSNAYGIWLDEVCEAIGFRRGVVVGASFGGLLIFKLAAVAPERISKAILCNPVGLSNISMKPSSLYHTLLPVFRPTRQNVESFLSKMVFTSSDKPNGKLWSKLVDYVEFSVRDFEFNGDYPTRLSDKEVIALTAATHLIVGSDDALIPQKRTINRAKELLSDLASITVLPDVGHGIELSPLVVGTIGNVLNGTRGAGHE
ncbi:MAG: alpha/beta hydrolase [Chloracidobacterium sp.]|nr:alpha/beta hydrolase [Chloracidobacterium sp.]